MGSLRRFNLSRIKRIYQTPYFLETGTWKGDGVAYALRHGFEKIFSSEIIPEIAQKAKNRFSANPEVTIFEGDSIHALEQLLPEIHGNCVFWLDAHFPGAEEGLSSYNETPETNIRLPLQDEIATLLKQRAQYKDVILIDDLRIYEQGPFESGNVPAGIDLPEGLNLDFILEAFNDTHDIIKSHRNEGYLMIFPKDAFKSGGKTIADRIGDLIHHYIY